MRDRSTGALAALKRLKNEKRLGRFEQEIQALKSIDHPGIVRLLDHDLKGERPYLVMEYCEGGSLADDLTRWHDLVPALRLVAELCDAIGAAHRMGVTHRDIKPENVLLRTLTGPPVAADFGICYVEDGERRTLVDEAVGARLYIAPELEDGRADHVSPRSDVYSLGKLLYRLLNGERVFSREQHRGDSWDLAKLRRDARYEHVNRLLDNMIRYMPEERLQDAGLAADAVREVLRLIEGGFNVVSGRLPQQCRYCGQGQYVRAPSNTSTDIGNFGLNPVGSAGWVFLVCDYCGHVEFFRRKEARAADLWDR